MSCSVQKRIRTKTQLQYNPTVIQKAHLATKCKESPSPSSSRQGAPLYSTAAPPCQQGVVAQAQLQQSSHKHCYRLSAKMPNSEMQVDEAGMDCGALLELGKGGGGGNCEGMGLWKG